MEQAMPALEEMHLISLERMRETGALAGGVGAGCREESLSADSWDLEGDLAVMLAGMRRDYMQLLQRMRGREHGAMVRAQLAAELERRASLRFRHRQLTEEINELVGDGLALLKLGLKERNCLINSTV